MASAAPAARCKAVTRIRAMAGVVVSGMAIAAFTSSCAGDPGTARTPEPSPTFENARDIVPPPPDAEFKVTFRANDGEEDFLLIWRQFGSARRFDIMPRAGPRDPGVFRVESGFGALYPKREFSCLWFGAVASDSVNVSCGRGVSAGRIDYLDVLNTALVSRSYPGNAILGRDTTCHALRWATYPSTLCVDAEDNTPLYFQTRSDEGNTLELEAVRVERPEEFDPPDLLSASIPADLDVTSRENLDPPAVNQSDIDSLN